MMPITSQPSHDVAALARHDAAHLLYLSDELNDRLRILAEATRGPGESDEARNLIGQLYRANLRLQSTLLQQS